MGVSICLKFDLHLIPFTHVNSQTNNLRFQPFYLRPILTAKMSGDKEIKGSGVSPLLLCGSLIAIASVGLYLHNDKILEESAVKLQPYFTKIFSKYEETKTVSPPVVKEPVVAEEAPVVEAPVIEEEPVVVEAPVVEEVPEEVVAAAPVEEVVPVVEEVVPVAEEAAPVIEEVAPVVEEVAPVVEEAAPVVEEAVPVVEEAAPIEEALEEVVAAVAEEVAAEVADEIMEEVAGENLQEFASDVFGTEE